MSRASLRHSLRRLQRRPGLTAVAVATLGLGLGGATAIFSVADAVLLRPLPYPEPDRLVMMWQRDERRNQPFVELSYPQFREWRDANRSFDAVAAMPSTNQSVVLTGAGEPAPLLARWVTGRFFEVLEVPALLGRSLTPRDDEPGAPRVAVISHAFWRERFAADAGVVGRSLTLDDQPFTIVGVMPQGFTYPKDAQLWLPLLPAAGPLAENANVFWMSALGRLKPGVSLADAAAEATGFVDRYHREHHNLEGLAAVLTPLADTIFGPTRPALLALLGAVGLVMLIACANVAGLLIVRLVERRNELAVRQALGASVASLARDALLDSLLLAGLGGLAGVLLARWLTPLLVALAPAGVYRLDDATVDLRAFLFGFAAALLTALLCALAPALLLRRATLEPLLRTGARGAVPAGSPLRSALVVAQVAVALVLLVGAGLLFRSFLALRSAPLGFEPTGVLSLAVGLPESRYPDAPKWRGFQQEMLRRVTALPGVTSAASVTLRPLWGSVGMDWPFTVEGQSRSDAERNPLLNMEAVSADYFQTMGIAVRRGRVFDERDSDGRPGVVVVSESLARRAWPGSDAVGQRLKIPLPGTPYHETWLEVVGVVADARYREIQATRLDIYMSFLQADIRPQHLVVRSTGDPAALAPAIREVVRGLDPDQPVDEVVTMTSVVSHALGGPRFAASVFGAFALVAVALATLGLYALLSFSVSRRTREIGLRMALGARPSDVRRMVLREGLGLAAGGIAAGLLAAAASARLLSGLLHGVQPADPLAFASVPVLLGLVAVLACLLPASRALRVDPAVALRSE